MVVDELAEDFEQLIDLIASTADIKSVLDGLTGFAAATMTSTTGVHIECAVTLRRHKRTATIGGSSEKAVVLDRIEQALGDGPCVDALEGGVPVLLGDVASDPRWPEYRSALTAAGISSALGIPMAAGDGWGAVLNLFSPATGPFTEDVVAGAMLFAEMASKALRLAIKIAAADQRGHDLKAAMENRSVIDLACGMIMAQNRCSKDDAFEFLTRASNDRNQKLYVIAQSIVDSVAGSPQKAPHFED
ncbi:GAF and ANTAR domain-containing protein [Arthrobacter sp. UYEF36]|uniref:GAF and ANTAR domain-containing protein n=1 Tax=Arthrobacter sp. UYEF36 TaxID=1756366 RepID=UPI003396D237